MEQYRLFLLCRPCYIEYLKKTFCEWFYSQIFCIAVNFLLNYKSLDWWLILANLSCIHVYLGKHNSQTLPTTWSIIILLRNHEWWTINTTNFDFRSFIHLCCAFVENDEISVDLEEIYLMVAISCSSFVEQAICELFFVFIISFTNFVISNLKFSIFDFVLWVNSNVVYNCLWLLILLFLYFA